MQDTSPFIFNKGFLAFSLSYLAVSFFRYYRLFQPPRRSTRFYNTKLSGASSFSGFIIKNLSWPSYQMTASKTVLRRYIMRWFRQRHHNGHSVAVQWNLKFMTFLEMGSIHSGSQDIVIGSCWEDGLSDQALDTTRLDDWWKGFRAS